jgi:NAD(P)-dependent dehydrogenase (short-subunit alcohol dehydrogenase family)
MKRVFVSGANRGIGLELVRQCLGRGDRVFAGCREPQDGVELVALAAGGPDRLTILALDVTVEATIDSAAEQVRDEVTGLDLLFNNAGANFGGETLANLAAENMVRLFRINAVGALLLAQRLRGLLREGDSAKVLNLSSEAGSISGMDRFRGYSYYGSKAALNMFTRCLAFDKQMAGVVVVALHPGWVQTRMGGSRAPLPAADSVRAILALTDRLGPADAGKFFNYDGTEIDW